MILWVDDIRNPALHGYPQAVWVKTAKQAVDYLRMGVVSRVFLDYDLGAGGNGQTVADEIEYLCELGRIMCPDWEIISANPVGTKAMAAALMRAKDRVPPAKFEPPWGMT